MNAHFRRDYLYRENGTCELLRYLKYDRKTKTYLFLTGKYKNNEEQLVTIEANRVHVVKRHIDKLYHLGYENTEGYKVGHLITRTPILLVS